MMLDWNEYRKQLSAGVREIGQISPDTIKGYMALSAAGQKTDLLGAKIRKLIALSVAVTVGYAELLQKRDPDTRKRGACPNTMPSSIRLFVEARGAGNRADFVLTNRRHD